jgi:hypothetical protein
VRDPRSDRRDEVVLNRSSVEVPDAREATHGRSGSDGGHVKKRA